MALEVVLADVEDEVTTRYQIQATISSGIGLVVLRVDVCAPCRAARGRRSTNASDVVLSIEIVSLPVGGMITRIAWGSTMRRIVCRRVMPERLRRLGLALVDRDDAGAHDLGHVGALVEAERRAPRRRTA